MLPLVVAAGAGGGDGALACGAGDDDDDEVEREGAAWDGAATVTVWTTGFAVSTIGPGASVVVGALVLAGSDETVSLAGVPDVVAAGTRWITT